MNHGLRYDDKHRFSHWISPDPGHLLPFVYIVRRDKVFGTQSVCANKIDVIIGQLAASGLLSVQTHLLPAAAWLAS